MAELITPDGRGHASFLAAMTEFQAEGRGGPEDDSVVGEDIARYSPGWSDPKVFAGYIRAVLADGRSDGVRPAGQVPASTLWYVEGAGYLGRITIRHTLTPRLLERGGHIGYDIRPSARRRGHATTMLRAALPVAVALGIDRVLITCGAGNLASSGVIRACGGVLEDERAGTLRYWLDPGGVSAAAS
jgi:predicted acetyltransferase